MTNDAAIAYSDLILANLSLQPGQSLRINAEPGHWEFVTTLARYLELDPNARYLGEVALVDADSAIYRSGLVFYNTLFDENAACHIALGASYPNCLRDGDRLSPDEYRRVGGNTSTLHTDFMIGSPQVTVTGIARDGTEVPIIRNGTFAVQLPS